MDNDPPSTTPIACRTTDGCRWEMLPDWQSRLLTPDGLPLEQWLSEGRATTVKHRADRSIYVVRPHNRAFYVKRQRSDGPARVLADLIRGTAARREWRDTLEARRRAVATARPVAFGERFHRRGPRESFFVTEAIDGAQPLGRLVLGHLASLPSDLRCRLRRKIIERLARFIAEVHQAGLRHHDLHAGNILVALDELDDPERAAVYLIDLAGARFSGPLDWAAARENLIVLHAEWFDRLTVAERWRFLKIYLGRRPELRTPPRDVLVDQLDRGARAYSRRIDRGRDRRALRTNRDFVTVGRSARKLHAVAELPESIVEQWLRRPQELLGRALDQPIKISHTTLVARDRWQLGDVSIRVALKRCRPRSIFKSLCDRFRRSRAVRGWYNGHALLARGIDTARPLAVCEVPRDDCPARWFSWRRWLAPRESYLAVEWIEGAANLHLWAWQLADRPLAERLRLARRCADSLGRLIGRMHARHVSHGDLKGSNLLVSVVGNEVRAWLIDTDGVRIHRRLSARRRIADLARLATSVEAHPWVTRSIRYRFLRAYAEQFPRGDARPRALWQAVARKTTRLIERKKRKNKPVL